MFTAEFVKDLYESWNRASTAEYVLRLMEKIKIDSSNAELQSVIESYEAKAQIVSDCIYVFVPQELKDKTGLCSVRMRYHPTYTGSYVLTPALTIMASPSNGYEIIYDRETSRVFLENVVGTIEFRELVRHYIPAKDRGKKIRSYTFSTQPSIDF